jgi:hypothetical protein
MVEYFLSSVYVIGVFFTAYLAYEKLKTRNKDGDPNGLDLLTASFAGVFWPLFVPIYVMFLIFSS